MDIAVLVVRIALAAMFMVAATAKLADRAGTRSAVVAFGAPEWLAPSLAFAVPVAELVSAALLLPAATAVVGGALGLALLALFTAAIGVSVAKGEAPDCHCFGQLHSSPAGPRTLIRNAALSALTAFALAGAIAREPLSAVAWIGRLDGSQLVALAVGVAACALATAGVTAFLSLLRSYGRVLTRLERIEAALVEGGIDVGGDADLQEIGLAPGTPIPPLEQLDLPPGRMLLVFTSPTCGPCRALLPAVAGWQRMHADALTIALASHGTPNAVRAEAEEFGLEHVFADEGGRLYERFQANGTPSAVLIADGRIESWIASGREMIERLVAEALAPAPPPVGLAVGAEPPDLELDVLDGDSLRISELRGRDTLLLFWDPQCGYCRAMHEPLISWESTANGSPRLVVVSSGDPAATKAEGFRSTVVLDKNLELGSVFGAGGTPMAVRIDADGRVASDVAAGEGAVFELLR
jgi:thiol-disulfide isomerase/thioredoxin